MGNRYWIWVLVRLGVGVAIVIWAASYMRPGSGEKEFQKTLDAMKHVQSFRAAVTANPQTRHNQMLWEVDCSRDLLHYQEDLIDNRTDPPAEFKQDQLFVAGSQYDRQSDGSWKQSQAYRGQTAKYYCGNLAQGTDTNLFPRITTMIKRGILQKGDRKIVNGVRCREWLVAMKGAPGGLEHDTVCIGLQDYLPYELTVDWEHSRSSFSDYNAPIQFDVPEGALQAAGAATASN